LNTALTVTFIRTVAKDLKSVTLNCSAVGRIRRYLLYYVWKNKEGDLNVTFC